METRHFGPSYYAIITGPVLDNRDLSSSAKLLYASITSMANATGYCWAGNDYLAERFGWGERTVSRLVAQLQEHGFIRAEMALNEQTRRMERRIYIGNEAALGVAKIGEGGVAKNGETTPYIRMNNKRKKKEKKKEIFFSPPAEIWERCVAFCEGDCELEASLHGFLEGRYARGKELATDRALTMLLNKLQKISEGDHAVMIVMLDKALERNWDSVFPLKADELPKKPPEAAKGGGYGWQ